MGSELLSLSFKDHRVRGKVVVSTFMLPRRLPSGVVYGFHGELIFIEFRKGKSSVGKVEISLCLN